MTKSYIQGLGYENRLTSDAEPVKVPTMTKSYTQGLGSENRQTGDAKPLKVPAKAEQSHTSRVLVLRTDR